MGFIPLTAMNQDKHFDIKALVYGNAGVGKTYMLGTYSKGPVHIYCFDPGGWKSLYSSANSGNISVADFVEADVTSPIVFKNFWDQLQADGKRGLFRELADAKGILAVDSLSTLSIAALAYAMRQDNKPYNDQPEIKHYGKQSAYLRQLMQTITSMPCAVLLTAHIDYEKNKEGAIVKAYPAVTGKFKTVISQFFDEMWLLDIKADKYMLDFKGNEVFSAKSRVIKPLKEGQRRIATFSLDKLYEHYMEGKPIE